MNHFDVIIVGGGCAGLCLAHELLRRSNNLSIGLFDPSEKTLNDRSWSFWSKDHRQDEVIPPIVSREWTRLHFATQSFERVAALDPLSYCYIRGVDYYDFHKSFLLKHPNFHWHHISIDDLQEVEDGVLCLAGGERFRAKHVFDSRPSYPTKNDLTPGEYFMWQHFQGWFVETKDLTFAPDQMTLMDFRVSQTPGHLGFFYVLPFSAQYALVEYTVFSSQWPSSFDYDAPLQAYMQSRWPGAEYAIDSVETGRIPMTNASLYRQHSNRIIPIGLAAGQAKSSTGYTFLNIQRHCRDVAQELVKNGQVHRAVATSNRFSWYDALLLRLLSTEPEIGSKVFGQLFRKGDPATVLAFLDERSTWWEEASLFARLPVVPFLRAAAQHTIEPLLGTFDNIQATPSTIISS